MLASNDNSYAKEYARRRHARGARRPGPGGTAGEMLLTDRGAYIKFLESQLDAVTQACLTAQSFDERIVSQGASLTTHDEKILNLARLIKCAQGVAEEQEGAYHSAMERVHERISKCESTVASIADLEREKVFAGKKELRRKGLAGGSDENQNPNRSDYGAVSSSHDGSQLTMGVLDAQFRAWADQRERDVDARVVSLERRLAARVDDGIASVLDAVRKAEHRLREESPRLAEHAARRLWTAAGSGSSYDAQNSSNLTSDPAPGGNTFPFLSGGVASGASVSAVADRVETLEASASELAALVRATRELQNTHAAELREHRAREQQREKREKAKEEALAVANLETERRRDLGREHERRTEMQRRAAEERDAIEFNLNRERGRLGERSDGRLDSEGFSGFWGDKRHQNTHDDAQNEALARSVEVSAHGFERLGAHVMELQKRLDARDAEIVELRAVLEKKTAVSYRSSSGGNNSSLNSRERGVPGEGDRRPAAMILAEAAALRLARDSVERARGIRVARSPPSSPTKKTNEKNVYSERTHWTRDEVDDATLDRLALETDDRLRDAFDTEVHAVSLVNDAEQRREKLAALYEKLEKTKQ